MANHCVEVVCAACGTEWCVRGCGFKTDPDKSKARPLHHQDNFTSSYDACPHCKGTVHYFNTSPKKDK